MTQGQPTGVANATADVAVGSRWEVVKGTLVVRRPDGSVLTPTAQDIYQVGVEGRSIPGLPPASAENGLTGLTFSKYPLSLEIHIGPQNSNDIKPVHCDVVAVADRLKIPVANISNGAPDHVVSGGKWYPLVPGALDEIEALLRQAGIGAQGGITLGQYLELQRLGSRNPAIRDHSHDAASAGRQIASAEFLAPPGFIGSLFPYQKDGVRWLQLIASQGLGGILADEMGLGKTVQIIALFVEESAGGRRPSLVVAPGTVMENWRREIGRFAPSLRVLVHRGSHRSGFPSDLRDSDVVVTSYDTLIRDISLFRLLEWNVVVLDEAQAIKNPDTRRASAAKRIPTRVAIAVTGTPVENTLRDLWSLTEFALPGYLGEWAAFERRFSDDADGAVGVEPLVSPILLRRRVADVAGDLPERIDIPQALELERSQAEEYERVRLKTLAEYGNQATLVALNRLRMFCTHPWLLCIIDGHKAVRINTGHPYYHKVYVPNLNSGVTVQGMDSLLWALSMAELGTVNEASKRHFSELRFEVSRLLRRLVDDLPEPEVGADDEAA